jgi:GntR family transcriptional regulator
VAVLKYELIADSLRQRIADGDFGPDDLLPSQRDLSHEWEVSRATVIKAYELLAGDGLVVARQGQGFRIAPTPVARPAGGRKAGSTRAAGGRSYRIVGMPESAVPPSRVAAALGPAGGLRRERLVEMVDGSPYSFVSAWFPADIAELCPKLAGTKQIIEGTTRYVARMTGRSPVQGRDVTVVRMGTAEEAELLGREVPFPVVEVLHTAYDADGRVLVVERGVTPGDLYEAIETYPMAGGR